MRARDVPRYPHRQPEDGGFEVVTGAKRRKPPPPQQWTTMPSGLQHPLRSAPVVVLASLGERPDTRTGFACFRPPTRSGQNKILSS